MMKPTTLSVLGMAPLLIVGACSGPARVDSTGQTPHVRAESGVNATPEHPSAAPDPTPSELADRVLAAYHNTSELAFEARVRGMGREILCHVECGLRGQHHLEVETADGKTVYILDQNSLPQGRTRIREQNLVSGEVADYIVTEEEFPNGSWDITQGDGLGFDPCLFGGYLHSWLGDTAHRSAFFGEIIAGGSYQGRQALGDSKCYVVETGRPQRPGEEVWIDCDSGLVRRWRDPLRDRIFDYHHRVLATDPSPADLALQVLNAYRRATELAFDARVTGMGREIICKVQSESGGLHHLEVQLPDERTIYILDEAVHPSGGMRIREHNLVANEKADYVLTDEEFPSAFSPLFSDVNELGIDGCLFGAYQKPWLGPTARKSAFFERIIAGGTYQGVERLGESRCHVVETGRPQRPGEQVWIDCDSGLVRRWRDEYRDRLFEYHHE